MAKIELTPEELGLLTQCINEQKDVPAELLTKLSPGFFEKLAADGRFDFKALDKFKIPIIEYAGKRPESIILAQAAITGGAAPLQIVRSFGECRNEEWRNMIIQGDNLQFLKTCYMNQDPLIKDKVKGKLKLIYIDPPFGTGDEYGGGEGQMSYSAKIMGAEFLEILRERLIFLREILANDGSIYVRIDYHFEHYIKVLMDEIFGKNSFKNVITINRSKRMLKGLKKFNVAMDSLLFYTKSDNYLFKELERERICSLCGQLRDPTWGPMHSPELRRPPEREIFGKVLYPPRKRHWSFSQEKINIMIEENRIRINPNVKYEDINGKQIVGMPEFLQSEFAIIDSNWADITGYSRGYPTQNPEQLLSRVILASSKPDDLVLDCFAGSGTTGIVAEKFGRKWIMCDFGKHAIYYMQQRFLNIANSTGFDDSRKESKRYGNPPRPFEIISAGVYDFTRIMDLRKNQDTYVTFVLGLFNIIREKNDFVKKYKLPNIYSEKNNNPVEVFPVWDDEYLKNIRIDEEYLEGIISASGGKLKGDYYIITPETCARIGDTTLKNANKEKVNFKLLKFPYKVLEELSRHFQIEEQAASSADINRLISSVGFYFNEEVKVEVERKNGGIKITKFNSGILDKNGQRFKGLEGLAMILVDVDYDGKIFDMDVAIYSKDIGEDGVVKVEGLTKDSHIIAIDKHGNESKVIKIK